MIIFPKGAPMPEKINTECKCPYGCPRHGECLACQEYHRRDNSRTDCGIDPNKKETEKRK